MNRIPPPDTGPKQCEKTDHLFEGVYRRCKRAVEYQIKLSDDIWIELCPWHTLCVLEPDLFDPEKAGHDV